MKTKLLGSIVCWVRTTWNKTKYIGNVMRKKTTGIFYFHFENINKLGEF